MKSQEWSIRVPGLALLACVQLAVPTIGHAQTPRDSVIAVVNEFFRAMTARDTAALARIQTSLSMHYAVRQAETVTVRERSGVASLRQLGASSDTLTERMWEPTVMVHGPLAILWAPYDIYRNAEFVHCGVDAFTLVRSQAGWQIAAVAYTMEPTGCAPSPLGSLRASPRQ